MALIIEVVAAQIAPCFTDPARAETYNVIAGEAITKGQVVEQNTSGSYVPCDMSEEKAGPPRGVALEAAAAGQAFSMLRRGPMYGFVLTGLDWDDKLYASYTAGALDGHVCGGNSEMGHVMALADPSLTKVAHIDCGISS